MKRQIFLAVFTALAVAGCSIHKSDEFPIKYLVSYSAQSIDGKTLYNGNINMNYKRPAKFCDLPELRLIISTNGDVPFSTNSIVINNMIPMANPQSGELTIYEK